MSRDVPGVPLSGGDAKAYSFHRGEHSVPPWRKFCSTMAEQNFLHSGTI